MTRSRLMLLAAVAGFAGAVVAQDDEPELGFLEYLGSWQEGDEEWLIVADLEEELEDKDEASEKDEETDETEEK
jgi:hypothetical protein